MILLNDFLNPAIVAVKKSTSVSSKLCKKPILAASGSAYLSG